MSPIDHDTIAAAHQGGTHRAHTSLTDIAQREDDLGTYRVHGRRCACCRRPAGPLTLQLLTVRGRIDRIADRAFLTLPAVDLRTALTGGAA